MANTNLDTNNTLVTREKEIRKAYKNVIAGSIRKEVDGLHANKLTVEIECSKRGCKNTRRVATSDLHQVHLCDDCTKEARAKRRKERLKGKAEAKANKKSRKQAAKGRKKVSRPDAAPAVAEPAVVTTVA